MDTGFSDSDAQTDFSRARRRQLTSALARRLRREPDDVNLILPFDEVVARPRPARRAAPRAADDRPRLDRRHRRPHARVRPPASGPRRAAAGGAGSGSPRRCGAASRCRRSTSTGSATLHFVARRPPPRVGRAPARPRRDRRLRDRDPHRGRRRRRRSGSRDLPLKSHERLFFERVPLPRRARNADRAAATAGGYAELAEGVEAWGFRADAGARASS